MNPAEWAKAKGIRLNVLQEIELQDLEEHDILCQECNLGGSETMLCPGLRMTFSEEDSNFYGALRIVTAPCAKYLRLTEGNELQGRLDASKIPPKVIQNALRSELPKVERDSFDNFLIDGVELPCFAHAVTSTQLATRMLNLGVAICKAGFTAKFVYPQYWYQHVREWDELGFEDIQTADWLYVERLDSKAGTDWAREQLFSAVQARVVSGLPTVVTFGAAPDGRNDVESEFLREIQTWPKL